MELVGPVAAGGVEDWDPNLRAGVALDGVGDWGVDDVFDVVEVAAVVGVVGSRALAPESSGPPGEEEGEVGGHGDGEEERATMGEGGFG